MLLAFKRFFVAPDPAPDDDPRGPHAARPVKVERLKLISKQQAKLLTPSVLTPGVLAIDRQAQKRISKSAFTSNLCPFPANCVRRASVGHAAAA